MFWYLPGAHGEQRAALVTFEKYMAGHVAHTRSELALGRATVRSPGMHVVALAYGRFSELMQKWLRGHAAHTPRLLSPYVPDKQLPPHVVAPSTVLKVPQGQISHGLVLFPLLKRPGQHFAHKPPQAA